MRKVHLEVVILFMLGWSMLMCLLTYLLCSREADSHNPTPLHRETHGNSLHEKWLKSMSVPPEILPLPVIPVADDVTIVEKKESRKSESKQAGYIPSVQHEIARRKMEHVVVEFWNYIQHELMTLTSLTSDMDTAKMVENILTNTATFKELLSADMKTLSSSDVWSDDWRLAMSQHLGGVVQDRINQLQNPSDCGRSRRLLCHWDSVCEGGFGCQLHHLTYCLMMAYATNRTLVFNSSTTAVSPWPSLFKPLSETCHNVDDNNIVEWGKIDPPVLANAKVLMIPRLEYLNPRSRLVPLTLPADLADQIHQFHGMAPVWWVGQFLHYIMRAQSELSQQLQIYMKDLRFSHPVVGVHVRRTDKLAREATHHSMKEYMTHVDDWFSHRGHGAGNRQVYLATDDPDVIDEAQKQYPQYTFLHNKRAAHLSNDPHKRLSKDAVLGVVLDMLVLSQTDHLVCTLTSNVCRAAYELMQPRHGDGSVLVTSLDNTYFFEGAKRDRTIVTAVDGHLPGRPEEIALNVNDSLFFFNNFGNGYSYGRNLRTRKTGLFPSYKIFNAFHAENMPILGDPT